MANALDRLSNLSENELILKASSKFFRGDQPMTILYRLHNLPPRRIHKNADKETKSQFKSQDFILNVKQGDMVHSLLICLLFVINIM